ncbi:MAG TPA: helix-turn-helix domain-containing protein [Anaerolineae bacterium]|nr:helix-turn-helix domain-containing protein [Anaerolineae bacterium]HXK43730.1 helix-turn-helix domain-containing protein [Anaerolineae bacterium]
MFETPERKVRTANANLDLFTIAECAAILNVSRKLVSAWIHHGELPAIKLGSGQRLVRVRKTDLEAFIERNRIAAIADAHDPADASY